MQDDEHPQGAAVAAAALALSSCLALAAPAATAAAAPTADAVPTVFFGDSYTANFGLSPVNHMDSERGWCFQAKDNYPAVAARTLAGKGVDLTVQGDVSCGGAVAANVWTKQQLPFGAGEVDEQWKALKGDTRLVVGSMGGNTLGFAEILKQCSDKLRQPSLLPGEPVDGDKPAAECKDFFETGDGKQWLDFKLQVAEDDLDQMIQVLHYKAWDADVVLVGYPRLVPQSVAKCAKAAPGQSELPFADIPQDALPVLDQAQKRLNDVMKKVAEENDATFVDLYAQTGANTACDGADRGIGGLLEPSNLDLIGQKVPWYAHPNEKGRDLQAQHVAATIEEVFKKS
ncbi:SGNH/GDSL hydrolase family protein [Kitasatospora saccharophila]|uniref:SGNH/GDSL hydrolase family protein n=1 Tax=Kitasatospora saccharophila TaxID=407973 RepID=UPI0031D8BEA1